MTGNDKRGALGGPWGALLACVLWLVAPPTAAAPDDPPAPAADDPAAQARQLFEEGVAAMQAQQWARAEGLFEQAYELKRHYQIAGNLGTCKLELGKHAEAATHLHAALTELGDDPARGPERLELKKLYTAARAQCSTLEIHVEPAGQTHLEVTVDGQPVNGSRRLVFLPPGRHQVRVHDPASGQRAEAAVDVEAGVTRKVTLQLAGGPGGPSAGAGSDDDPPTSPDTGLPTYPIWIGIGATVAATGVGVALRVVGGGAESDADQLRDDLRAGSTSCAPDCPELLDRYGEADGLYDASTGLFITAGALAAATVGYAVLTLTSDGEEPAAARLTVNPLGGLQLNGTF